jgi:protein CWC15
VARRDLRAELAEAERIAAERKRKAAGLPALQAPAGALRIDEGEEEERVKRRKVLEEALEADRDDDEDDEDEVEVLGEGDKGKGKATVQDADDSDEEEEDE